MRKLLLNIAVSAAVSLLGVGCVSTPPVASSVCLLPVQISCPCPWDSVSLTSNLHAGLTETRLFPNLAISNLNTCFTITPTVLRYSKSISYDILINYSVHYAETKKYICEVKSETRGYSKSQILKGMKASMSFIGPPIAKAISAFERQQPVKPVSTSTNADSASDEVHKQSAPGEIDIPARLKKLKELKDSGSITEPEYESQRKILVEKL